MPENKNENGNDENSSFIQGRPMVLQRLMVFGLLKTTERLITYLRVMDFI